MKKKYILILAVLLIICSFNYVSATEAAAGQPGLVYDFYYEWDESWEYIPEGWTGTMVSLEYKDNSLVYNIEGTDPSVILTLKETIELSEYPFIKIKVKNPGSTSEKFEMYIARDDEPLSETNVFQYVIGKEQTEFKEFIIDAKQVKGNFWTGEMTTLRLDGLNNPSEGEQFFIEYIAFFKTQADAQAWTPDRNQTPKPTAEPTPTPSPSPVPTEKPAVTNAPAATSKNNTTDTNNNGFNPTILIVCAVVILAAVAAAVLLIVRAKKNQQG